MFFRKAEGLLYGYNDLYQSNKDRFCNKIATVALTETPNSKRLVTINKGIPLNR